VLNLFLFLEIPLGKNDSEPVSIFSSLIKLSEKSETGSIAHFLKLKGLGRHYSWGLGAVDRNRFLLLHLHICLGKDLRHGI
jgi:hypothetical protein